MKLTKSLIVPAIILSALVTLQACKAKKLVQKSAPPVETPVTLAPVEQPKPAVVEEKKPELDVNTVKIQFDFNSSILKTESYSLLDAVASEMKLHPSAKYFLNGYASIEGTNEQNLALSTDRANSVKSYLLNAGVNTTGIEVKGYGTSNPVADNNTEEGKILNRRVEIKTQN
ncbi:OmpA family protein [Mucilaginibacter sp.]|uniref:OmpA family protein n=1 Tax=Mucilaginibacter sp. TaxID=1882438 RepID=UPI0026055096|nr:OmpA family protein [Mucilaginibacter sp.]MDB5031398.1 oprF 2 [Mucilaginibacter sp.]